MSVEERLVDSLAAFDGFEPSPDLYARVELGVAEDRVRRRRVMMWIVGITLFMGALVAGLASVVQPSRAGVSLAPRWSVAIVEAMLLVAALLAFGPAIRRFGAVFVAEVFDGFGDTGARFLRLIDIAYYLVFSGFILSSMSLRQLAENASLTSMLERSARRVAEMLLAMGLMHAVTLSVLPVIGLIHASTIRNQLRASGSHLPTASDAAIRAERITQIIVWILVVLAVPGSVVLFALVGGLTE